MISAIQQDLEPYMFKFLAATAAQEVHLCVRPHSLFCQLSDA